MCVQSFCIQSYLILVTLTSANVGEVDSIDGSSEERTLGTCEVSSAVQCDQDQCLHGKQGVSPSLNNAHYLGCQREQSARWPTSF